MTSFILVCLALIYCVVVAGMISPSFPSAEISRNLRHRSATAAWIFNVAFGVVILILIIALFFL